VYKAIHRLFAEQVQEAVSGRLHCTKRHNVASKMKSFHR